jgi:hypothetical protein
VDLEDPLIYANQPENAHYLTNVHFVALRSFDILFLKLGCG